MNAGEYKLKKYAGHITSYQQALLVLWELDSVQPETGTAEYSDWRLQWLEQKIAVDRAGLKLSFAEQAVIYEETRQVWETQS